MEALHIPIHIMNVQAIVFLENISLLLQTVSKNAALSDHTTTLRMMNVFVIKVDFHRPHASPVQRAKSPIKWADREAEQFAARRIRFTTITARTADVQMGIPPMKTAPVRTIAMLDFTLFLVFLISFAVPTAHHTTLVWKFANVRMEVSHHKVDLALPVRHI